MADPALLQVSLDVHQQAAFSFTQGCVLYITGTVPAGLTLTVQGSSVVLTGRADLTQAVQGTVTLNYGVPGQAPSPARP
ncbi:hypothetical protein DM785_19185 (plasmid) [Deinococcus actinosclerus]|nr:hypothetical protein DM785_19185 [Deinococcus actinosclerus]